ncbi:MAG: class I SAM-dependent methyltransferase [Candidatus Manganitrophus sp.]|nr:class I SAM-dependent methyltransferase [Candidatus Manganitrophus sp.]
MKVAYPDLEMVLLEATGKKAAFLHHLIGLLRLQGVSVVQERLEQLNGPTWEGQCDLLLDARRFSRRDSPKQRGWIGPAREGRILFFQGPPDASRWEKELKGNRRLTLEKIHPVVLPFTEESRSLVLFKVVNLYLT